MSRWPPHGDHIVELLCHAPGKRPRIACGVENMTDNTHPLRKLGRYFELARSRALQGHESVTRQVVQMAALAAITGNGPGFYQMAGFWRKSVPWRDKRAHLGASAYRRRVRMLNPLEYRKITQNKLPEKALLSLLGFPTPPFVGFLHALTGRTALGAPLRSADDLARLLDAIGATRLCFKPSEGWGGKGIEIVDVVMGAETSIVAVRTGARSGVAEFVDRLLRGSRSSGFVIERYLRQHPDMAAFNPSSVNTCRVWVVREPDRPARIVLAYLRIGRGGSVVDNQSSGGIVAPIDLEGGNVGVAIDGLPTRVEYGLHPDHGAAIAGRVIPRWTEVKALAVECLGAVPHLRFAGLDIAVGPDGPVVLELNASPDREGAAFAGVPTGDVLPSR